MSVNGGLVTDGKPSLLAKIRKSPVLSGPYRFPGLTGTEVTPSFPVTCGDKAGRPSPWVLAGVLFPEHPGKGEQA